MSKDRTASAEGDTPGGSVETTGGYPTHWVAGVDFFEHDRSLITVTLGGHIRVYDVATGQLTASSRLQGRNAFSVAVSPDETVAAIGTDKSAVVIVDLRTLQPLVEFRFVEPDIVPLVRFAPDGSQLVAMESEYRAASWASIL